VISAFACLEQQLDYNVVTLLGCERQRLIVKLTLRVDVGFALKQQLGYSLEPIPYGS
jgi:hypothetical protein